MIQARNLRPHGQVLAAVHTAYWFIVTIVLTLAIVMLPHSKNVYISGGEFNVTYGAETAQKGK